jgi:hypothetical protein
MLEKVSKIQNEQVPALVDTIRDQISSDQADAFKAAITPVLASLYETMTSGRETADSAVRTLSGEQPAMGDMSMGGGLATANPADATAPDAGLGADMPPEESDLDADSFDATDAAAGGSSELGRERR